ncbi:IS3 family transposase [Arthrobacter sp. SD76]|uniref:IS3 family transposase n=1 Tax=Arthrobacter sp. SD76 TaxID=3415007 RepID=UPI003C76E2AE
MGDRRDGIQFRWPEALPLTDHEPIQSADRRTRASSINTPPGEIYSKKAGATQFMSRKANCYDNAVMENFFGHLKEELFHHVRFMSTDALTTAMHEYISWYNTEKNLHQAKGPEPGAIPCSGRRGLGS